MSQNSQGYPLKTNSSTPRDDILFIIPSLSFPALQKPPTSPFISAMKTGTPMALNDSAITLIVTVFPVPLAPAIRPCLFAYLGRRWILSSALAIHNFPSAYMIGPSLTKLVISLPRNDTLRAQEPLKNTALTLPVGQRLIPIS
ncbi:hypothetical protein SDC9_168977 [bioreactor metagenome]|uniref:Uncharacterized protein n=1 Tax=bioreactor metagenome TaxID=1076179 RepID=A0A645G3W7_9ZZZZ